MASPYLLVHAARAVLVAGFVLLLLLACTGRVAAAPLGVFEASARSGVGVSVETSAVQTPIWLDARYWVFPAIGVGVYGQFSPAFGSDFKWAHRRAIGAQAAVRSTRAALFEPWLAINAGYGWLVERRGPYALPVGSPDADPYRTNTYGMFEFGVQAGADLALSKHLAAGPYVASAFAVDDFGRARSVEFGVRGSFRLPDEASAADVATHEESEPAPKASAGVRLMLGPVGSSYAAEGALYPLSWLGAGVQMISSNNLDDLEYCERCLDEAQAVVAFVEGRLFPDLFVTPYARVMAGAGHVEGQGRDQERFEGTFGAVGGEAGVDMHGAGLSLRVMVSTVAFPSADISPGIVGAGMQLGTLF